MALINQKNQHLCLYYANTLGFEEILRHHRHFVKKFELTKYKKHRSQGKTTKHRVTRKEQELSRYRSAVQLSNLIIFYKKMLKEDKFIFESDVTTEQSLYNFLNGGYKAQ